eukprot:349920-Chlamydomonas_euryale.AAC.2
MVAAFTPRMMTRHPAADSPEPREREREALQAQSPLASPEPSLPTRNTRVSRTCAFKLGRHVARGARRGVRMIGEGGRGSCRKVPCPPQHDRPRHTLGLQSREFQVPAIRWPVCACRPATRPSLDNRQPSARARDARAPGSKAAPCSNTLAWDPSMRGEARRWPAGPKQVTVQGQWHRAERDATGAGAAGAHICVSTV